MIEQEHERRYGLPELLATFAGGGSLVLAEIIDAAGSTPQVPGAWAVFSSRRLEAGTVGGGIVEGRVHDVARLCLADGRSRLVDFQLDADPADREGAICGGTLTVIVDPAADKARPAFEAAAASLKKREQGLLLASIVPLADGDAAVDREWLAAADADRAASPLLEKLRPGDLRAVIDSGRPRFFKLDDGGVFARPVLPLPRLIVAGAGHVGRAVAHLGRLLDFEVTVIDDRPEFANRDNIPDADNVVAADIAASLSAAGGSPDDYYVIVTRGHENDAAALRACIKRPAAYIGMIGSRSKIAVMRSEFLANGWATGDEWDLVHTPIGIAIRSQTVEEIAVSIAAELVLVRAGHNLEAGP